MATAQKPLSTGLAVGLLLGTGTASLAETWVQPPWRQTIHYRATFESEAETELDAVLQVAAADSYEVFLNGTVVGVDSTATRLGRYDVTIASGENQIGVRVVNHGRGAGNGVALVLAADSLHVGTTTNHRLTPWYWSATPQAGTEWTTADFEGEDGWHLVQGGNLDAAVLAGLPAPAPAAIAGLPDSVDFGTRAGGVILGDIRGRNLARAKPSNHPEVVDGDLNTSWDAPTNSLNFLASVDLQERHHINLVRVLTRGRNEGELESNSLRGYSVQVSDDQIRWTEVGVLHDITQFDWTEVAFSPVWTRYVRIVIVDIDPTTSPKVGELEVFGEGFPESGTVLSDIHDLGLEGTKNIGLVSWEADVPRRTELSVRLRAGDTADDFADPEAGWSEPLTSGDVWFPAREPAALVQYRVDMVSHDDRRTPELRSFRIDFDTAIAVAGTAARVSPNEVPMGADTMFTYTLDLSFADGDLGVSRLELPVPSEARLDETAPVASLLSGWESSQQTLTLAFAEPLVGVDQLIVPFTARTYSSSHAFRAVLYAEGSDNPLNVSETDEVDPDTGSPYSWSVRTTTADSDVLSAVRSNPGVLTPNSDAINDGSVIEFVLSKVDQPRTVRIQIYDLGGRLVRDLGLPTLSAGVYQRARGGTGEDSPGYWDGRDDSGSLVAPGVYLYRVEVDLDTGDDVRTGTVGVAY